MKIRQSASRASLVAIVALLLAAGPAAAGGYSPKHLRADAFLRLRTLEYEPGVRQRLRRNAISFQLGIEYPMSFGPTSVVLRLSAHAKLRRLVKFEVRF